MRTIKWTRRFKRDRLRVKAAPRYCRLDERLTAITDQLTRDISLPENCRDHTLSGDWQGYRECHVWPDLLLVYEKPDPKTLRLVRLGSPGSAARIEVRLPLARPAVTRRGGQRPRRPPFAQQVNRAAAQGFVPSEEKSISLHASPGSAARSRSSPG
jgi:mRNA interferase YafQ